jgi:hypothetical protein
MKMIKKKQILAISNILNSFLLLLFLSSTNVYARELSRPSNVKSYLKKIKKKTLMKDLRSFIRSGKKTRMVGTAGHKSARNYLKGTIKKIDPDGLGKLTVQEFTPDIIAGKKMYQNDFNNKIVGKISMKSREYKTWQQFTTYMMKTIDTFKTLKGQNIIWEKEGQNKKDIIIIGAHYDTISHHPLTHKILYGQEMPGADYNASGVSIGLSLINRLKDLSLERSVRVVFFDFQGIGMLGSEHYASMLKLEVKKNSLNVHGLINLEMLGHDSSLKDKKKKLGNMAVYLRKPSAPNGLLDDKFLTDFSKYQQKCKTSVTFEKKAIGFDGSDNFRFWKHGFAAITFSQNWEDDFNDKNYHTPNDFAETLNSKTLYNSYVYIGCSALSWLLDL